MGTLDERPCATPVASERTTQSGILAHIMSLAALAVGVRVAGFAEKQVMAGFYGTSSALDAFFVAQSVPMSIFFLISGVITPVFLPVFVRQYRDEHYGRAYGQVLAWTIGIATVLVLLVGAGELGAPLLVRVLAPGFDEPTAALCVQMVRVFLPCAVLLGLQPLFATVLNGMRRFWVAPVAEFTVKLVSIALILMAAATWGVFAAVAGAIFGIVASFAVYLSGVLSHKTWMWRAPSWRDPGVKAVALLMLAPGIGMAASQLGSLVENAACSTLAEGTIAGFSFAKKILNLPLLVISLSSGTVLFTYFSELSQATQQQDLTRLLSASLRGLAFLFLPIMVFTAVLAEPIVTVVYERGAFNEDSTALVAQMLLLLAPSMLFLALEAILMRHFFSRSDLWTPMLIGVACVGVRVTAIFALLPAYALAGVVAAIVLSRALKVVLLVWFLVRRTGVSWYTLGWRQYGILAVATSAAGALAWATKQCVQALVPGNLTGSLLLLTAAGAVGSLAYLLVAYALGSEECAYLKMRMTHAVRLFA